jgi:hypothetical protein
VLDRVAAGCGKPLFCLAASTAFLLTAGSRCSTAGAKGGARGCRVLSAATAGAGGGRPTERLGGGGLERRVSGAATERACGSLAERSPCRAGGALRRAAAESNDFGGTFFRLLLQRFCFFRCILLEDALQT